MYAECFEIREINVLKSKFISIIKYYRNTIWSEDVFTEHFYQKTVLINKIGELTLCMVDV